MKLSKEAKIGALVLVAIIALIWGINYLKGTELFSTRNTYYAVYNRVNGLVASNPVIMNGYKVGFVEDIEFMEDKSGRIVVTVLVDQNVFVSKSSIARIVDANFLGSKALDLELGMDANAAHNGDTLNSELQLSLTESLTSSISPLKDKSENLITTLDSLGTSFSAVMDAKTRQNMRNSIESLNINLQNLERITLSLAQMTATQNGALKKTIENMQVITATIANNHHKLTQILDNVNQISDSLAAANLAATIRSTNKAMNETAQVMAKINAGEGSLGLLVNDKELYNNLNAASADLDKLLIDLKANPKRYVQVSVFGKKQK
ncbi:MAG TPA: MlaD family protein [Bacteroidia bacterium]|nr:MlaD family protein [Bacteroidia bacterium]HNT79952.1 MlaD family protein [Bacteroidia bacterium]